MSGTLRMTHWKEEDVRHDENLKTMPCFPLSLSSLSPSLLSLSFFLLLFLPPSLLTSLEDGFAAGSVSPSVALAEHPCPPPHHCSQNHPAMPATSKDGRGGGEGGRGRGGGGRGVVLAVQWQHIEIEHLQHVNTMFTHTQCMCTITNYTMAIHSTHT